MDPAVAQAARKPAAAVEVIADKGPGYPCRVCLSDAAVGEKLLLASHRPFALLVEVAEGSEAEPVIARLLADPRVRYLHVHNARPGCYAARIERG